MTGVQTCALPISKSTEMARDAAITFFNFIEFVLSVLFFMSLNLLFNFILFVLVYLLSAFFCLKIRNDSRLHQSDRLSYILRIGYTPDGLVCLLH